MGSNRKRSEGLDDSFDNEFDDIEIVNLCEWLDRLPLSVNQRSEGDKRSQRKVSKDFADGVLLAELLKHYFPKLVDLHNYTPANATQQRMENWYLLNRKVLNKLGVDLSKQDIRTVSKDSNNLIHRVLMKVREQIDRHLQHPQEALVPVKGFRSSNALVPAKQFQNPPPKAVSPRRYGRGEIPHSHPDRSTYNFEKRLAMDSRVFYLPPIDSVPRQYLEEKEAECIAKDDTIRMLSMHIRRLEHLMQLRDDRLFDLQGYVAREQGSYQKLSNNKKKLR